MFISKRLIFLLILFLAGMNLLAACATNESRPSTVEDALDTQPTTEAVEAGSDSNADKDATEELDVEAATGPTSENQVAIERDEVPRVTAKELKELIDNGASIVIGDTRVDIAYNLGHIPGAVLATGSQVETHLNQIPLDQEIILYCACGDEYSSAGAALTLYENGYTNVSVLLGGIDKWKDAGYPVEES